MQKRQPSSKATVQALHSLDQTLDTTGTAQGARRATEAVPVVSAHHASTEVVPRAKRHFKSNAEKRRIVADADACTQPGEVGFDASMASRNAAQGSGPAYWSFRAVPGVWM